jgi:hypothetical protein
VTVTVKLPVSEWLASIVSTTVLLEEDNVTLVVLSIDMGPLRAKGETLVERLMVPANPFWLVRTMFTVPADPLCNVMLVVLAEIVKSGGGGGVTVKVAGVVRDRVPLVPVIVTVKVPTVFELHEIVAVPEVVMLLGVTAPHVRPAGAVAVRVTVPVKPLTGVTVIVDVAAVPTVVVGEVADKVQSVILNVAVVE